MATPRLKGRNRLLEGPRAAHKRSLQPGLLSLRLGEATSPGGFKGTLLAAAAVWVLAQNVVMAGRAPGPDAFGYTVAATTNYTFVQITNGPTRALFLNDDQPVTNASIGFSFNFYGTNYTTVSFNPNGLMTFGGASWAYFNVDLTATPFTNNLPSICVLWDDWETLDPWADAIYYKTTGTAPSRQFIVQWNKVVPVNGDGTNTVTFEARLFEGSDKILLSYFDAVVSDETTNAASLGVGATVGIRDISGETNGRNLEWSYNQAVITNGLNLLFTHPNHPPTANNDTANTAENNPVTITVLGNDTDADGDALTLVSITQGTNGAVATNLDGTVTYTPAPNFFGADHFAYSISDGNGGSATGQVSVTVFRVNQPPTLDALSDLILNENAGLQTVNLTGITSGATNENDTLAVTASSSNPGLIPTPMVSYTSPNATGSLSLTPVTNAFGTATVTVTVNDGQPSNNIVSRSFTVTVNPVNQPPTLDPLGSITLEANAGPQTISLTGITSGATNENDTLTVTAASSNTELIPTPMVSYTSPNATGSLSFAPVPNAFGTTTLTVTVNDGQPSNNIVSRSFAVTVNPPAAKFKSIVRQVSGGILLHFQGTPGRRYTVEASSEVHQWSAIGVATEVAAGEFEFQDTGTAGVPMRFYRAVAGTANPPPLLIQSIIRTSGGSIVLGFQGIPGGHYTVEASADLQGWGSIGTASEGVAGVFSFEDTGAVGLAARFYRLRTP